MKKPTAIQTHIDALSSFSLNTQIHLRSINEQNAAGNEFGRENSSLTFFRLLARVQFTISSTSNKKGKRND